MQLDYTIGNWTIKSHEVDSISVPKTVSIPDLDYVHDFSVASADPNNVYLINVSGSALIPVERMRYGKERVSDIYRNTDIPRISQFSSPIGARAVFEDINYFTVTNAITGSEQIVPTRLWTCIESIMGNVITGEALLWSLLRHIAQMFPTGAVDDNMLIRIFRGDLDPTR